MNANYVLYNKSVHLILLSLSFLEKVPSEYFCAYEDAPDQYVSCKPAEMCKDPTVVSYYPNMELKDSFINWVS